MPETQIGSFIKQPDVARIRGGESAPLLEGSKRSAFLQDYLRASQETDKKYPGHYQAEKTFAEEFIDHPERFRATEHAVKLAYADFVIRPTGKFCWPQDVGSAEFPMDADALRNVESKVDYAYSSTLGGNAAIHETWAEVRQPDGSYQKMRSGGVAFGLRDWVERIPDEELEQLKQG